jgi:hypothetical protein
MTCYDRRARGRNIIHSEELESHGQYMIGGESSCLVDEKSYALCMSFSANGDTLAVGNACDPVFR